LEADDPSRNIIYKKKNRKKKNRKKFLPRRYQPKPSSYFFVLFFTYFACKKNKPLYNKNKYIIYLFIYLFIY